MGILELCERQRVRLFIRRDPFERFFSCLVFVPRDRYNTRNRERIQEILAEAFDAEASTRRCACPSRCSPASTSSCGPSRATPDYDREIEARIVEATGAPGPTPARGADRGVRRGAGAALSTRYGDAFPVGYRETGSPLGGGRHPPDRAPRATATGSRSPLPPLEAPDRLAALQALPPRRPITISDVLPMFENMGCACSTSGPTRSPRGRAVLDPRLRRRARRRARARPRRARERFQDAFARLAGEVENDGFNRLVLAAGLDWREVAVLRAFARYLRQTGMPFSQGYMERAARATADRGRLLRLFRARFDPGAAAERRRARGRIAARSRRRSTRSRASTTTASCALPRRRSRDAAHQLLPARRRRAEGLPRVQARPARIRTCRCRGRCSRSSSTRRASRACTCAWARSRAAACAGPTAARTSAPRSSA